MTNLLSYVNIGGGLPFFTSILASIIALILSLLAIFLAILRRFYEKIRKFKWLVFIIIILILSSILIFIIGRVEMGNSNISNKVIVLGIDALDRDIMIDLINQGKLPNFKYLQERGSFNNLSTVNPSQSPVVWASFITGVNPAAHGIFDFVKCDKNYKLDLALTQTTAPESRKIFGKKFQVGKPKIVSGMRGKTLWQYTTEHNIPTYIFFLPNTFPSDKIKGKMLSGMGVPDIYGTEGTFSFYTQDESFKNKIDKSSGKIFYFDKYKNEINTIIPGPKDISQKERVSIPIKIIINNEKVIVDIEDKEIELTKGNWSDWIEVKFNLGFFKNVYGICRFYLKDTNPLALYLSPINFDPRRSPFPISYPKDYSEKLVDKIGLYHTLGMPYDTKALSEGVLTERAFLEQTEAIFNERKRILFEELPKFKNGIFIYYFNLLDSIQHTFWRFIDSEHPLYEESQYKDIIYSYYQKMDKILGKVLDYIDSDTTLIILSDHGFTSFRRSFHLNSWLRENGYLYLKNPNLKQGREFFQDIDWSKTKAYGVGFNGIYINIEGRQSEGVVKSDEVEEFKNEIVEKLEKFRDFKTGESIINKVYKKEEIYKGNYFDEAPDLIVGYNKSYRASWQTALGGVPEKIIVDHLKKWSGTHLVDPIFVPGILVTNKKVKLSNPNIIDILPTVLKLFNISKPEEIDGRNLF